MSMAQECSTHRYLMNPSVPPQGVCPHCLTQRLLFLQNQQKHNKQLPFSLYKERRSNNSKSFCPSLFGKLHCGGCLRRRKPIFSDHPTYVLGKNHFSGDIPDQTHFPVEDSNQNSGNSTGSDCEWASLPDGVLCVKREVQRISDRIESKQERATCREIHLTALKPPAPYHVNGVDHFQREQAQTALRPLESHQFNGADHFERAKEPATLKQMHLTDESSDGDVYLSCTESSPSLSSGTTRST
ncbi:hypothetical protein AMTR_s00067p00177410 [Amborella trichopoda]|uniref:Uncharacterized protein n=1 Tax=Amborella trichopoda TaxID=13333 RepID=U5CZX2_AMBTC|nr:hypothetical protein AMTR_s00067p00177410 [Amborella trichopoda]